MSSPERTLFANDPTAGLELVTGDTIALEATRHIFLASDLLDPARSRDIGLKYGGEELQNRCLRRTNGLLPRCQITPMEVWGEALPAELFPDGVRLDYRVKGSLAGVEEAPLSMGAFNPRLRDKPLYFMPIFPGEMIVDALGIPSGQRRGVVEITALLGTDYGTADREMQALFFPEDYVLPIALRLIHDRIELIGDSIADPDVKSVANDMVASCEQTAEYMGEIVSLANTQLDTRVKHDWTYRLTPKIRHFMAQLEITPRDNALRVVESKVAEAAQQGGISPDQLEQILTRVLGEVSKQAQATPSAAE